MKSKISERDLLRELTHNPGDHVSAWIYLAISGICAACGFIVGIFRG